MAFCGCQPPLKLIRIKGFLHRMTILSYRRNILPLLSSSAPLHSENLGRGGKGKP